MIPKSGNRFSEKRSCSITTFRPAASGSLAGERAAEQAVLLRAALVTGGPEIKEDERREQIKRDVQIADVDVGAGGEDQRIDDAADGRDAADEAGGNAGTVGKEEWHQRERPTGAERDAHQIFAPPDGCEKRPSPRVIAPVEQGTCHDRARSFLRTI